MAIAEILRVRARKGAPNGLLPRLGNQLREHHAEEIRMEATLAKAEAIVSEML